MTVTLLALSYVGLSFIMLHMHHDMAWERNGQATGSQATGPRAKPCATPCEDYLGLQTCIDRGVSPRGLLCHNVEKIGMWKTSWYQCECPFEPLLMCNTLNSTSVFNWATTGTCVLNKPACYWAATVVVALLIALHGLLSCLLCGCNSKAKRGGCSIPGWGLVEGVLGTGIAGPGGSVVSKAMHLV
ncbi:hypothetical protein T492DRAFT_1021814 [Pavlovales sp. CCMP2436]|nr:hypothetical protein T492DRAFT_1021814 [Pavlovales sp. CCMP2436]|mmetsp:Transcript_6554/g.17023  ORF Transcript_6554/g.17023 Transcript_6554/m.17023 type:complete len:186 (+) Transcript_6554:89-646(+)